MLAGEATHDLPFQENHPRWGASAVLRPEGPVLGRLTELSASLREAAGPGHWSHGPDTLHLTLRSLEPYRAEIPAGDPLRLAYARAARQAWAGLPPVRIELSGVSPHAGGVLVEGNPLDGTLEKLAARFAESLGQAGTFQSWQRDRWYVSLMHFAQPLGDPHRVVSWCDTHADSHVGVAVLTALDIVQSVITETGVRLKTLARATR